MRRTLLKNKRDPKNILEEHDHALIEVTKEAIRTLKANNTRNRKPMMPFKSQSKSTLPSYSLQK